MLAMDINDNAPCLDDRVVWRFFASRLAPTIGSQSGPRPGRLSGRLAVAFVLEKPASKPFRQTLGTFSFAVLPKQYISSHG
ncbi:hypothetical protein CES87_04065 [Pseudomonas sp. ERMR1:02]|nr:hypothetical protein CES87_04065 [Pseudomonas sp. ERMR1:02]